MAISIAGTPIDKYITQPQCGIAHRSRSVAYTLNGNAREDRLGGFKKTLTLTFGALPEKVWEPLKAQLQQKTVAVTGYVGMMNVTGSYRLTGDELPTPVLVVIENGYYCQNFSISLEEI